MGRAAAVSIELDSRAASSARALQLALAMREPSSREKAERVRQLAKTLATRLGLSATDAAATELAASVQDVGRLAVPDAVLDKRGPLEADEWQQLRGHAIAASALLDELPELRPLATIVRAAHERWDSEGYPDGLAGEEIPLPSRVLSACDAYVAMTSNRPFRKALDEATALHQLKEAAGGQLDPQVVEALAGALTGREVSPSETKRVPSRDRAAKRRPATDGRGLIAELGSVGPPPALLIARERLLEMLAQPQPSENEAVSRLEVDPGLAVHVLRAANDHGERAVTHLPDAVRVLAWDGLGRAADEAPALDFVWPQTGWEAVLEGFRLHAVAVQRATLRLAGAVGYEELDELAVLALLHDVGRLALTQVRSDYGQRLRGGRSADERLRIERRLFGFDHATVGGIVVRQWGLPERLAEIVGEHHDDQSGPEAQLLCLGDAVAHHTQGKAPLPAKMIRLAQALGLSPEDLRSITFELPHFDGSRRVRTEPCPLTERELDAVRGLSEGKVYEQIAQELGVKASTIRSHLHNAYEKLGVADRAQAVMLAAERGWL